jgi:hypothetical protein
LQEDCRAHIAYLRETHGIDEYAALVVVEEAADLPVGALADVLRGAVALKACRRRIRRYLDRSRGRRAMMGHDTGESI